MDIKAVQNSKDIFKTNLKIFNFSNKCFIHDHKLHYNQNVVKSDFFGAKFIYYEGNVEE